MKTKYLIVGAGLAGSTCAYLLKRAGEDVVLLERQDVHRKAKLCAGLVTPRAEQMLHRIFGSAVDDIMRTRFDAMRCHVGSLTVDLHDIEMKSVQRPELDAFALQAYLDAGGTLVDRFSLVALDTACKTVEGLDAERATLSFEYDCLIAADGALSSVRRMLTGHAPDAVLMLETEIDHVGLPLIMDYDARFFGYSWYAPVGERAKLGCACYRNPKGTAEILEEQLAQFAARAGVEYGPVRGAFCPTGSDVLLHRGSCYFLGDAASLVCPPSGEGIYYALYSAWQLARALTASASYPALMQREVSKIKRQYRTRNLFFNRAFTTVALNAAKNTPYGAERAVKFALRHFAGYEG